MKPIVSHERAKLPPIAFTSIVPYKDKLFLIGGESIAGATKKVLALDRISISQLEGRIAELEKFIKERKDRLFAPKIEAVNKNEEETSQDISLDVDEAKGGKKTEEL